MYLQISLLLELPSWSVHGPLVVLKGRICFFLAIDMGSFWPLPVTGWWLGLSLTKTWQRVIIREEKGVGRTCGFIHTPSLFCAIYIQEKHPHRVIVACHLILRSGFGSIYLFGSTLVRSCQVLTGFMMKIPQYHLRRSSSAQKKNGSPWTKKSMHVRLLCSLRSRPIFWMESSDLMLYAYYKIRMFKTTA